MSIVLTPVVVIIIVTGEVALTPILIEGTAGLVTLTGPVILGAMVGAIGARTIAAVVMTIGALVIRLLSMPCSPSRHLLIHMRSPSLR